MSIFEQQTAEQTQIFEDRDVLTDDHVPETIVGRDDEKDDYVNALMPVYQGDNPKTVFCHGPNGVGKTATTEFMMDELQSSDNLPREIHPIWLDCETVNTGYQLAIRTANELRPDDAKKLKPGLSNDAVFERLFDALDEYGGTVLLIADEIGSVRDIDGYVYQVCRARSKGKLTDTKVGLIGLTTDGTITDKLNTDASSSLRLSTIHFSAYDANELREVLNHRVSRAFAPNALEDDVVPLCAAFSAAHSGDARKALDLLETAGELARKQNSSRVTESHVREAKEMVEVNNVFGVLTQQNENARLTAYALTTLVAEGEQNPRTAEIHSRYRELAPKAGRDPVGYRQVFDYLDRFDELGLVTAKSSGGSGGNRKTYRLEFPTGDVARALGETIEKTGVHPSVENYVSAD